MRLLHRPHGAAADEAEDNAKAPGGTNAFFLNSGVGLHQAPPRSVIPYSPTTHKVSYASARDAETDVEADAEAHAEADAEPDAEVEDEDEYKDEEYEEEESDEAREEDKEDKEE